MSPGSCRLEPRNELIGNFCDSARNVKLTSEEMSNFVGNQAAGGVMVMDMSSSRQLHSLRSSGVLDEVSPSLHQVSTDVSGYLNLPSPKDAIMVDPRGTSDGDGIMGLKSLSDIRCCVD